MNKLLDSAIEAIGNTPLVRLDRLTRACGVVGVIVAKLDYLNPGFSKKDRAARGIIEAAEQDGTLLPGQTVVELTSGNMGTGLALVCGIKGYPPSQQARLCCGQRDPLRLRRLFHRTVGFVMVAYDRAQVWVQFLNFSPQ